MKPLKSLTTFVLLAFVLQSCAQPASSKQNSDLEGIYVGLEEIGVNIDPSQPNRKWYHMGYLRIKGDSAFLDQQPVSIYRRDTSYSASDGAFYYYKGTYKLKDNNVVFNFKLDHCDYCAREVRKLRNGEYEEVEKYRKLEAIRKSNGLLIKNHLYRKDEEK